MKTTTPQGALRLGASSSVGQRKGARAEGAEVKAALRILAVLGSLALAFALGAQLLPRGRGGDALEAAWQEVAKRPEVAAPWVALARAQAERGQLRAAELSYRTALQIEPGLAQARVRLGYVLYELGRDAEAQAALEEASAQGAKDGWAQLTLASMRARVEQREGFPRFVLPEPPPPSPAAQEADQAQAEQEALRAWAQAERAAKEAEQRARAQAEREAQALREQVRAAQRRAAAEPEPAPEPEPDAEGCAIALSRRGPKGTYRVTASIDGAQSTLIFDTGASLTVISRALAQRAGVTPDDAPIVARTASGPVRFETALVERVEVGDQVVQDVRIAICDGCETADTDGLLGLDVQHALGLVLDPAGARAVYPCE